MNKQEIKVFAEASGLPEAAIACYKGFPEDYSVADYDSVFKQALLSGEFVDQENLSVFIKKWDEVAREKYFLVKDFNTKLEILECSTPEIQNELLEDIILSANKDIESLRRLKFLFLHRPIRQNDLLAKIDCAILDVLC